MALAGPHVGVPLLGIQPVAVGGVLGAEHGVLQFIHRHGVIGAGVDDLCFKQVAAENIHNGLGGFGQRGVQQGQLLLGGRGFQHLMSQDSLVEDGGRFRQGHGRVGGQVGQTGHTAVVPGMAQLMGNGAHIREAALEIGHDQAAVGIVHPGAEGATGLSLPGIQVNPPIREGMAHEDGHFRIELAQLLHQLGLGLVDGVGAHGLAHRGKQVVEGQAVFMAQQPGLGPQVAAEMGQIFLHRAQHGVQGRAIHAAVVKGHVQHRVEVLRLGQGAGLLLNAVQAVAHGQLDLAVGGQLRLVGVLADRGVRVIGHAPHRRQGQGLTAIFHGMGGIQLVPQLAEGVSAGQAHFQHPGLQFGGDGVAAVVRHFPQGEGHRLQHAGGGNQLLQVGNASHIAGDVGIHQPGVVHEQGELVAVQVGALVFRVHGLGKEDEAAQAVGQGAETLTGLHQLFQPGQVIQRFVLQNVPLGPDGPGQGGHVPQKSFVLKACVQERKIPLAVHGYSSIFRFSVRR